MCTYSGDIKYQFQSTDNIKILLVKCLKVLLRKSQNFLTEHSHQVLSTVHLQTITTSNSQHKGYIHTTHFLTEVFMIFLSQPQQTLTTNSHLVLRFTCMKLHLSCPSIYAFKAGCLYMATSCKTCGSHSILRTRVFLDMPLCHCVSAS